MPAMYCPACDSSNLTQEGLSALAIRLGYWRCLDCGRTIKPLIMPDRAVADAARDDAGEQAPEA